MSIARAIEKCAWSEAYTRTFSRSAPRGGRSQPSSVRRWTSRASVIPMMLAMTPPDVRTPQLSGPKPSRSRSQPVTSSSTSALVGPACHTSTPWLVHCASTSPAIEIGSAAGVK